MSLAERLDKFLSNFDPFEYADCEGSVEKAEIILQESPETVISDLLDILEDMEARGQI